MVVFQTIMFIMLIAAGLAFGIVLPLRYFGNVPGFSTGFLLGSLPVLLAGLMCAYLFGGWGEAILGSRYGVPLGVFIGSVIGSIIAALVFGALGAMLSKLLS